MKIFFDARYTRYPRHDGVSRYGAELLKELLKIRDDVTVIISDEEQLTMLPQGIHSVMLNKPTSPLEPFIAGQLNRLGAEVVFSPLQTMGSLGRKYKLILTIHDLIYYTYRTPPSQFNPLLRLGWRLYHLSYAPERLVLDQADAIAVVSETTRKDVLEHKLTKKPVAVIPNAAPVSTIKATTKPPKKNLIYMGSFVPYKNVDTLVDAMSLLPEYTLQLLSKVDDAEKERLTNLADNPSQLIFENGVSDEDYHAALSTATGAVSASRFEGFNIPILEAQQAGAPVICSDIAIHHEVAGDSALFFNPDSPQALAKRVRDLENTKIRKNLIAKGRVNTIRYNWALSAKLLSELIDTL